MMSELEDTIFLLLRERSMLWKFWGQKLIVNIKITVKNKHKSKESLGTAKKKEEIKEEDKTTTTTMEPNEPQEEVKIN